MAKDNKNTEPKETLESTETLLSEKEMYLLDKEEKLAEKEEALLEREQNLLGKEEELTQKEAELKEKEATLNAFEEALAEREQKLQAEETTLLSHAQKEQPKQKKQSVVFEFRGEKYQFAADAPSHILFEGRSLSQEAIIKEEDALVILIGGNSSLIEKV